MPYPSRVKILAQAIDPGCWRSYSGCSPTMKRMLDARRNSALNAASKYEADIVEKFGQRSAQRIFEASERCRGGGLLGALERLRPSIVLGPEPPDTKIEVPKLEPAMSKPADNHTTPHVTPLKLKMLLHAYTCPTVPIFETMDSIPAVRQRNREKTYAARYSELMADGLVTPEPPAWVYSLTGKGEFFVEQLLAMPLPVPVDQPKWVMPK